jgi:hypothetical protein
MKVVLDIEKCGYERKTSDSEHEPWYKQPFNLNSAHLEQIIIPLVTGAWWNDIVDSEPQSLAATTERVIPTQFGAIQSFR